jgi:galactokinase
MVQSASSIEQLIHMMPSLRVTPCAFPDLTPHHPGWVELVYDTLAPAAAPQPAYTKRRRMCEAAALQRKRARMLAPWVLANAPRRGL